MPDFGRSIKNEEAVWRAFRMFQAHCRKSILARFQEHIPPVYYEFLDFDRLFFAALPNPLDGEHRMASHSRQPGVARAQLCIP